MVCAGHQKGAGSIGVGRLTAAVDHQVVNPMIEDQQRSFPPGTLGDAQVGAIPQYAVPGDPGGVNHYPGVLECGPVKLARVVYLDAADADRPGAAPGLLLAAGKAFARPSFAGVRAWLRRARGVTWVDGTVVRDLHRARSVAGGLTKAGSRAALPAASAAWPPCQPC